jgi:NitT/TauT family transport system substrate-binding protein
MAQTPAVLHVATTPTDSGAAVYYAEELGLFKKANLDVQVQALASGAAVAAGVASGTIDIAQGSLPSIAAAHEKHIPFVLVAPGGLYADKAPTSALVVSKSSTLKTAKDMQGKTLANNALKNIGEIAADAWLDKGGADVSSVHVIEMPLGEMESALGQGRIDAAILVEPSLGKALAGNIKILAPAYSSIAKEFMINAWFANESWAKSNGDALRRFDTALREAGRWANNPANRAKSAAILEKYTKIAMGPENTRILYADTLEPALIQPVIDASAKFKVLKAPFPAAEFIYTGTH